MERIADKVVVGVSAAVLAVATGISAASVVVLLAGIVASAAYGLLGGHRRWRPALPALSCAASLALVGGGLGTPALCALPLAAYDLARTSGGWPALAALPPLLMAPLVDAPGQAVPPVPHPAHPVVLVAALASLLAAALALRTESLLRDQRRLNALRDEAQERLLALASSRRQLEAARASEAEAATLAERARISRELHDSVGHLLTRATFQVEALVVAHEGEPRVQADLRDVGATVREALDVTRRSVHALADDALDLGLELNRLAQASPVARVSVACDVVATPPAEQARCIVAICREALTNAARHAHAATASVRVIERPAFWQVTVTNDGDLPALADCPDPLLALAGRGMGLRSMSERVLALDGRLRVSCSGEFAVFASIPKGAC